MRNDCARRTDCFGSRFLTAEFVEATQLLCGDNSIIIEVVPPSPLSTKERLLGE